MNLVTNEFARQFAKEWIENWNAHDIEKVLSHYTDDFIIESPTALQRLPETNGIVKNKGSVREYWISALQAIPNLKFELLDVFLGVNSLSICYKSCASGQNVVEVMLFNQDLKIYKTLALYSQT